MDDGNYVVTDAIDDNQGHWWANNSPVNSIFAQDTNFADHTGDLNGRYLAVNASFAPGEFYRQPVTISQTGTYQVSVALANANNLAIQPNVTIDILDSTGTIVATGNTGDLPKFSNINYAWQTYWLPASLTPGSYQFVLTNNAPGGVGNDLFLDDIKFQQQDATPAFDTDASPNTITFSIGAPANQAPAANANSTNTAFNTPVLVTFLANDTDPDGDTMTVTAATLANPANGTLTNAAGAWTFTPAPGFTGTAVINYTIADPSGATASSTHVVTVFPDPNTAPTDDSETTSVLPNSTFVASVADGLLANANDSDGDPLSVTGFTIAGIPGTQPIGSPASMPGIATITINADGSFTFTPATGYSGPIPTIIYTVDDGNGGTDTSQLNLTVEPPANSPPVALSDLTTTTEGVAVAFNLLANDTDPDGNSLTVTSATLTTPSEGTLTQDPVTLTWTFTPASGVTGDVVISYTIADPSGATASSTHVVTVFPDPNTAPTDDSETTSVLPNLTFLAPVADGLLANANDSDGDPISVTGFTIAGIPGTQPIGSPVSMPGIATITINADGSFTFTPATGYSGPIPTIIYTVDDGNGGTDTSQLNLTVEPPANTAPIANPGTQGPIVNYPPIDYLVAVNLLGNDTDPDGDTLTVISATLANPADGILANFAAPGDPPFWTFTPVSGFAGTVVINYTIQDQNGATASSTHDIIITAPPTRPPSPTLTSRAP